MKTIMYHPGGLYLLVMMMLLLPLLASTPVASAAAPIPEVQPEGTAESGAEGGGAAAALAPVPGRRPLHAALP
eukprot:COSAG01_NODE_9595_length_2397_cov_2.396432_2_plen_73_part_00